jgi:hypothetical protein
METTAEKTWKLLGYASDLAVEMLNAHHAFSLVGYSERADGEVVEHRIYADSDTTMYLKARKALQLATTVRFALVGEGGIGSSTGFQKALLCYIQDPDFPTTICMYQGYRPNAMGGVNERGQGWTIFRVHEESWL